MHAAMTADALRAGKAVYVEKPLAIDLQGLEQVRRAVAETGNERLQVGFNRRFAPLLGTVADAFHDVSATLVMHYRVHAGQSERNSWYLDPAEGSRFVGEAGHFFDTMTWLARSRPLTVFARSLRPPNALPDDLENVAAVVTYENGSIGNLLYLTQGGTKLPKEHLEVFGGGIAAQMHNFESVALYEGNRRRAVRGHGVRKGQREELAAFVSAVRGGQAMPIPVDDLIDTTLLTLAAAESLRSGTVQSLTDYWQRIA
jgi:predicted dehydrogenase